MPHQFTVAVAGASGRFGRCVVQELLKKPNVLVRGLVRDKSKLSRTILSTPSLEVIEGDATDADALGQLVKGADVVISALMGDNSFMHEAQMQLIDIAEEANVPRFVASDYSLDYTKLEYGQLPSKDPMKQIHEYLQTKTIQGVHVMIGAFLDTFWTSWFGIWNREELSLSLWGSGDEVWELTSYENAAQFVAEVALDKDAIGVQKFLGDRISSTEISKVFEEVYGQAPTVKRLGSLGDLKAKMDAVDKKQDPMAWLPWFYQYYCLNGQASVGPDALASKYPLLKHVSVGEYLRSHTLDSLATAMFSVGTKE